MKKKILLGVILSGFMTAAIALVLGGTPTVDAAGAAKNLKVLPKDMPIPEIKKVMKSITAALGVECDFCHNTDDMSLDTEHKETARKMMTMTAEINKTHFEGKFKVGCVTCHNGQKEPKSPK